MKRRFRFYLALLAAKFSVCCLRLVGRKGTNLPGGVAIYLCKDFLGQMPRPETIIGITGTNGKTTVANMVEDVLARCGYDFVCNQSGSNVDTGVASALIANSTLLGKPKKPLAVFELDERSANLTMTYIKPDLLLVTNIFRDSYKRNAHPEFIVDILERFVPDSTRLVLNADDLMCASLKPDSPRSYFSILRQPEDGPGDENIVQDVRACPRCGAMLAWDFRRYHHIGRAACPRCGFASPQGDCRAVEIQPGRMLVELEGRQLAFPLPNRNMINVYNALAAVALLHAFGLEPERIAGAMAHTGVSATRYKETDAAGRKVILHLAKGQNPVACSRAFQNIRDYPGKKAAILFLDDFFDAAHTVENISWLYDADFEFLAGPSVTQVVVAGARHWDVYLRLLMAGADPSRVAHMADTAQAAQALDPAGAGAVFILYDVYTIPLAEKTMAQVKERLEKEGGNHG
ncbi:MurT ligase domain-containing protein [Acutalibacter caecimuris]|uniref:MurT ligase domain-containing protein n=1 Tax=Acutalibacter caecimuris TaxID=3093657 RepID=UPI002AC8F592|nr:MurT ligase domain-containing protein [Acutalibacter sp. M00118]